MLDTTQNASQEAAETARVPDGAQDAGTGREAAPGRPEGQEVPEGEQGAEGSDPQAAEGEGGEAGDSEHRPAEMPPWMQRRIDQLTRQRHEAERRAQAAEARLSKFNQAPAQDGEQAAVDPRAQAAAEESARRENPEATREQIQQAAQRIVAEQRFNDTCNTTFEQGAKQFPDFERVVGEFRNLGGLPREFLDDVLEAGNAHVVLHHLGRNLDEADRVMTMPPRARAIALARLSDKLSAPPPPKAMSKAPPPVDPVGGAGRPSALNTDPDSLSTSEWMRRRDAGEIR